MAYFVKRMAPGQKIGERFLGVGRPNPWWGRGRGDGPGDRACGAVVMDYGCMR